MEGCVIFLYLNKILHKLLAHYPRIKYVENSFAPFSFSCGIAELHLPIINYEFRLEKIHRLMGPRDFDVSRGK